MGRARAGRRSSSSTDGPSRQRCGSAPVPGLAARHRVIAYDQRGHGASPWTGRGARIARLAADLWELLDHLDLDAVHLVGHSMGCSVSWSLLDSRGSSRIRSLVVLDQPSACTALPWMEAEEAKEAGAILDFAGAEQFAAGVLGPDSVTVREAFLRSMLSRDIPESDVDWMREQNLLLDKGFGARLLMDHVMQDWRDVLPTIDVPTLVVAGEASHVAVASQEWTAGRIPGARLVVVPASEGGSHFPFVEGPENFVRVLDEFVDSAGQASAPL